MKLILIFSRKTKEQNLNILIFLCIAALLLCNNLLSINNHSDISFNQLLRAQNYMCSKLFNCTVSQFDENFNLNSCNLYWCDIKGNQTIYLNSSTLIGVDIDPSITINNNNSLILSKNTVKKIGLIGLICGLFIYKKLL